MIDRNAHWIIISTFFLLLCRNLQIFGNCVGLYRFDQIVWFRTHAPCQKAWRYKANVNIFCFRDQRLCSVNGGVHENRGVLKERFHCDYSFVVVFFPEFCTYGTQFILNMHDYINFSCIRWHKRRNERGKKSKWLTKPKLKNFEFFRLLLCFLVESMHDLDYPFPKSQWINRLIRDYKQFKKRHDF